MAELNAAPAASKPSDLVPRLIVAAIGVPALLSISLLGPNWGIWLVLTTAACIGTWEYTRMTLGVPLRVDAWTAVASVGLVLSLGYWQDNGTYTFVAAAFSVLAMLSLCMRSTVATEAAALRFGHLSAAAAYCGLLFGSLIVLVMDEPLVRGPWQGGWLLWPMVVIWSGDTGAYFAGRSLGRHKLAPRISPAKTREGAAGGLIASVVGAYIAWLLLPLPPAITWWMVLAFALPGALVGQLGDLAESLLKRSVGVKDSSRVLYGHGGMLDRVDALIFAGPWFVLLKEWLQLP